MGLLANAVAIANRVTLSLGLQGDVIHEAFVSQTSRGDVTYGPPVARKAIITRKNRMVASSTGEVAVSPAQIVLLDPSVVVTLRDRFSFGDGRTQPVIDIQTPMSAEGVVLTEIFCGQFQQ